MKCKSSQINALKIHEFSYIYICICIWRCLFCIRRDEVVRQGNHGNFHTYMYYMPFTSYVCSILHSRYPPGVSGRVIHFSAATTFRGARQIFFVSFIGLPCPERRTNIGLRALGKKALSCGVIRVVLFMMIPSSMIQNASPFAYL